MYSEILVFTHPQLVVTTDQIRELKNKLSNDNLLKGEAVNTNKFKFTVFKVFYDNY